MDTLITIITNLILTIIIEVTTSVVLGINKKDILKIVSVNTLTNVPLNVIVNIILKPICTDFLLWTIILLLEVIVVLIEGKLYKKLNDTIIGEYRLSILLNSLSFSYVIVYILLLRIF